MPSQSEIRQSITEQIVAALAAGTAPWRRPWSSDPCAGAPKNAVSNKNYSGVNPLLLHIAAQRHGFKSRYWATYRQWTELGAQVISRPSHVPAGEWGCQIVFCKPCRRIKTNVAQEESEERFWLLRTYTVFNVDQVSGSSVDRFRVGQQENTSTDVEQRFQLADDAIEATGADIRFGGDQAFYQPDLDYIQMPHRHQFQKTNFYDSLFHELCHWSEHPTRLNWDRTKPENAYALGELIAELGACYLAGELELPLADTLGNHASYLQNWLGAMNNDCKFIFKAAAQATRAADFILSFSRQQAQEPDEVLMA
jgi:antirestriction protein ArdC